MTEMRKFARDWVQKYPSIARLNDAITGQRRLGAVGTITNYVKAVKKLCSYLDVADPETLLKKFSSGELDAGNAVDKYIDHALEKEKYAHGHVRNLVFGVKKWLGLNGVRVNREQVELPTSTEISEEDRAPTKEELKRLLNHASSARDRAVIYCDTSSGLRIGTLLSLKVGDVDFDYPDVARFTVERKRGRKFGTKRSGSQGNFFCTFITPEAKKALHQYSNERETAGEKLNSESPLFTDTYYTGKFISVEDFERVWARLMKRAGLAQKSNKWCVLHVHTLRKYFRSNCIGVDASYRERWMGHKGLYLDMSYFKAEENLHLAEYRKTIQHLTIYGTPTEQKNLVAQAMKAFAASYQGVTDEQLKRIDEIFARAKDVDEAIQEFRRLREEPEKKLRTAHDGNGKYLVAKSEEEIIQRPARWLALSSKFEP